MADLFHTWAGDLAADSTGDIAISTGTTMTTQRIYRRLLTNAGDYIWNLTYGGGLASYVGRPADGNGIESVVRSQLQMEPSIAQTPAPDVTTHITDAANGVITVGVNYLDADSNSVSELSFRLGQ